MGGNGVHGTGVFMGAGLQVAGLQTVGNWRKLCLQLSTSLIFFWLSRAFEGKKNGVTHYLSL
jgi:hypothetical protein